MTSEEIESKRVEKLKEINSERERLNLLYEEKYVMERKLVELSEGIRKARHMLAVKKTEAEILQSEFFRARQ